MADNEPDSTIREAISFTRLAVMKEEPSKQGVAKTRNRQTSRPEQEKSLIIPAGQKTAFRKGERTHSFQEVRLPVPLSCQQQGKDYLVFCKKEFLFQAPGGPGGRAARENAKWRDARRNQ